MEHTNDTDTLSVMELNLQTVMGNSGLVNRAADYIVSEIKRNALSGHPFSDVYNGSKRGTTFNKQWSRYNNCVNLKGQPARRPYVEESLQILSKQHYCDAVIERIYQKYGIIVVRANTGFPSQYAFGWVKSGVELGDYDPNIGI